jgi:hypothetical protein
METLTKTQRVNWPTVFCGLLLSLLLAYAAFIQIEMRSSAQLWVVIISIAAIFLQYFRMRILFIAAFLFILIMIYTQLLVGLYFLINPNHGWTTDGFGERQRVMETSWIPCLFISFILAAVTFKYYEKYRSHKQEMLFVLGLFVISVVVGVVGAY